MNFEEDERAQSVLVGAILLFAILIVAFSSYQAFVVPNQNAEVEFNHNDEVQTDIQDLRNSLLDIRSVQSTNGEYDVISEHRPVRVRLGTQYPPRLIALNPPPASGTIESVDATAPLRIENAEASGGPFESDPSALLDSDLETAFLSYRSSYTEYRDPPDTVLEHSLLYNEFQDTEIPVRQQTMIRPETNRLNIVLFEGDVSRSGAQAVTLDPETLDGPTASVPIEPDGGDITIQIPTQSPEVWEEQIADLNGVTLQDSQSDRVIVTLDDDEYDLRVTRVGFDGGDETEYDELTPIQLEAPQPGGAEGDPTLPGPRVFNAAGPDEGEEPLQEGDTFDLTADVSNLGGTGDERGGTPIQAAEWYIEGDEPDEGEGFSMTADDGEYLQDIELSVTDSVDASDLEDGTNTLVIRAQDSRGIWGEETNSTDVDVQLDAAGTVTLQSDIQEDDESFEVTTADFENLDTDTGGFLVVENNVEFEIDNVGESTETIDVDDVGGIEAGDEITATLYEDDTRNNELDSDTTTVLAEGAATPALSNLNIAGQGADATITEGESGDIEVDVENDGDQSGTFTIDLEIANGQTVTDSVTTSELTPGASETVTFVDPISGLSADEYTVTVADEDEISSVSGDLRVEQPSPQNELYPDTEIEAINLDGDVADLRENDEGNWYEAIDDRADTSLRVGMDDPAGEIDSEQTIRFHVRQDDTPRQQDGDPEAEFYLYEDGEEVTQLGGTESITTTEGETFIRTFDADEVDNPDDVEFRIDGFENGAPGGNAVTVEVGYVTWEPAN